MAARGVGVRRRWRIEPLRPARLAWLFFRIGAMNELQYRVNFVIQVFQSLVALGTGLVVLALVFSKTSSLGGWTRPQLLAVMGVHILVGGVINTSVQPNMERLMEDVEKGTLDYALTKPDDAQVLVSVREVRIWQAVDILMGAGVLIVAGVQLGNVGVADALAFIGALALGATIIYCFWLMLASSTFWVVQVWQILELFQGVYAAGRWPVGIYPLWLKTGLTFLVPLAFAVTVPAEGLTSRLNGVTLLGAAGFTVALLAVTRWVWKRGLRRYAGASA